MSPDDELRDALRALWPSVAGAVRELLPNDAASLRDFYPRLQQFVATRERRIEGTIDRDAIVRGDVIALGAGSVIEAGAVIHESCRLVVGARSHIRAGALLRDEIVIGDDCLVGAHCDLTRSVLLGPDTALGHAVVFNDSIAGAGSLLSAFIGTANTHLMRGREIAVRTAGGRVETGRTYLGALIGDGVRIGPNTSLQPGTIVLPNLAIPPASVLLGIIDAPQQDRLMRDFFERWGSHP